VLLAVLLAVPVSSFGGKKKKDAPAAAPPPPIVVDYSRFVWPNPPAIARVKFTAWFAGDKVDEETTAQKAAKDKKSWMDRLAGTRPDNEKKIKPHFQLLNPYGMGVDSKGRLYVADAKVGAIFVFNTETRDTELIKNGVTAHFAFIIGLAVDDSDDRVFVSDRDLRHVLVISADRKVEASISEGLVTPGEVAVDSENRLLYVSDVATDQVMVYDADTFKLIRRIGTGNKQHTLTTPGDFARPGGMAVDKDGNLYVADTMNNRIEIFDADGGFIKEIGKHGDGPGDFARPKGVAVDSDGHIWVADGMQDRVHVLNWDGQLLTWLGGKHSLIPGDFSGLVNVIIDKKNRVFTSEIYPGRVQQFRYITDAEAETEKRNREKALEEKVAQRRGSAASVPAETVAPKQGEQDKPEGTAAK
jgi:sugar lactone lactonase YvrE